MKFYGYEYSVDTVRALSEGRLARDPEKGGTRPGIGLLRMEKLRRQQRIEQQRQAIIDFQSRPVKLGKHHITAEKSRSRKTRPQGRRFGDPVAGISGDEAHLTQMMRKKGLTHEHYRFVPRVSHNLTYAQEGEKPL